jgi:UDP-N-acetylmuramyl tripeptide synthase
VRVEMAIGGLYNVYNALGAVAAALALDLPEDAALLALRRFGAAFGRQEAFDIDGRQVEVLLGKNPAGLNQVLATLKLDPGRKTALFVLNDDLADGRLGSGTPTTRCSGTSSRRSWSPAYAPPTWRCGSNTPSGTSRGCG